MKRRGGPAFGALLALALVTSGCAAPRVERVDLAVAGEGAHTWRIPALEVLLDGTLVAAYDRRNHGPGDLPGDIDVVVRYSRDRGRSWSPPQVVLDYDGGAGAGDPSLLVDRTTGRIFLFHAYGPPGIGFRSSGAGNQDTSTSILHADYAWSDDGGGTWRTRRITSAIKQPQWLGLFAASGRGLQLASGRLLQQYTVRLADGSQWAVSAYSDDHGETWRAGAPVGPLMDENKVVELADGRVLLNARTASARARLVAYSHDGGLTWGEPRLDAALIDPGNNAAILRFDAASPPGGERARWLLFSNTASTSTRERLTVRLSCDDGATWSRSRVLEPGPAGYSTLVRLDDGTFGILYERDEYRAITFARFDAAWLGEGCAR